MLRSVSRSFGSNTFGPCPSRTSTRSLSQYFRVVEHVTRCSHTRDRPAGIELGRDEDLRLSIKQYIPKDNSTPGPNAVTLIGAHANAFPKELYEPLWDDIYEALQAKACKIRGIWIADQYNQGKSGVLNEELLGPDPSWWDHGRDLMNVINQFQDEIPHPIIGVGHSMGATQLTHLALMHPRLLDALVSIDPVIQTTNPSRPYAPASTYRRDLWPSREEAAEKFAASKFYQKWDPRVLEKWIEFGLRDLPTEQYPSDYKEHDNDGGHGISGVTLTTTKAQEVYMFLRPAYHEERLLFPKSRAEEVHPEDIDDFPLYRPEPAIIFRDLERLSCDTLYIFGETSELSDPEARTKKMNTTGVGIGGSGGRAKGKVEEVVLDCGHLVPMERTRECALAIADYIERELQRYETMAAKRKAVWEQLTRVEKVQINDRWRTHIGGPPKRR